MRLNGLLPEEIKKILAPEGFPSFRAGQIFYWLHRQMVTDFSLMTNLPKTDQEKLSKMFNLESLKIKKIQRSRDKTKKYLLELDDGNLIETVLIQDKNGRKTVCASTQAGCPLGCLICASGQNGLIRNLTSAEIVSQIELLYKENSGIENVVFMGMGEPLLNLNNVIKAVEILNHKDGLNIGARKITVSTAGIPEKITELAKYPRQIRLAVSLNSAINEKRTYLMPINKKYPLNRLIQAVSQYIKKTGRRVTFEYVLINDFNDQEEDVRAIWEICKNLNVNINLIPLNSTRSDLLPPPLKIQEWFLNQLLANKINAVLRKSKGGDILAACGQLAGSND